MMQGIYKAVDNFNIAHRFVFNAICYTYSRIQPFIVHLF